MESNEKKKIRLLILSYHFLPMNVIASYRAVGFAENLDRNSFDVTVITHLWELNENSKWRWHSKFELKEEKESGYTIIRVSRVRSSIGSFIKILYRSKFFRGVYIFLSWLLGYLDADPDQYESYQNFRKAIRKIVATQKVDLIISIFSPHHHLKLCYKINKRYDIPYVLDFRDLWDNSSETGVSSNNKIYLIREYLIKRYWKRWISNSIFFTTISSPWVDLISRLSGKVGYRIMHGFDADILRTSENTSSRSTFILLYVGTAYNSQDWKMIGKGIKKFTEVYQPYDFSFIMLGSIKVVRANHKKTNIIFDPGKILSEFIDKKYLSITNRKPRKEVLNYYSSSSILLMPAYKTMPGTYSGKFFEYIGANRPILAIGDGKDVICQTVRKNKLGVTANNVDEIADILRIAYRQWKKHKNTNWIELTKNRNYFSRKNQTELFEKLIMSKL